MLAQYLYNYYHHGLSKAVKKAYLSVVLIVPLFFDNSRKTKNK